MTKKVRKFSEGIIFKEYEQKFFSMVEVGKTYRYDGRAYLFSDLKKAAKKYGVSINYNDSRTIEYFRYGSCNFTVMNIIEMKKIPEVSKQPVMFNVEELAI